MNIIVTGASRGIGYAVAEQFAAPGHHLLLCARNGKDLEAAATRLSEAAPGVKISTCPADLSKKEEAEAFGRWCLLRAAPDIVVNNAGYFLPGSIYNEAPGQLESMMAVNLYSAYHLTRQLLPPMMEKKQGHIFNICSIASLQAYANGGSYSISKFALLGFSKNLREELKPFGIKVTSVLPGAAYTDSWSGSGVDPNRIMEARDIAIMIHAAAGLSPRAVPEDIIMRPQLGDL
jgi:short-subunit dehydrogenase